jgi:8-oxo-dGTP diphosphatase
MNTSPKRGVSAILVDDQNRVLLQLRDDKPDIYCPGQWCLFGGGVEPGETPLQAFVREVREELAIVIDPAEALLYRQFDLPLDSETYSIYGYLVHVGARGDSAVLGEGQAIGRIALDDLAPLLTSGRIGERAIMAEDIWLLSQFLPVYTARKTQTHPVAAAIVTDQQGRLLMQLRDDSPNITHPGHWGLFGGSVEAGESPHEAIQREIEEELTIQADASEFEAFEVITFPGRQYHIFVFDAGARGDAAVLGEGQALGRFAPGDIAAALDRWAIGDRPIMPWVVAPLRRFLLQLMQ